ncbi:LysR family transcriptional regulator [Rhodopseudomonas sp. AAP120]|uniref:LysR family transcriptional regulator n=1 Tax=Rhodopseudomonas sp. AAP120 TaxID=1523430 RepID=UPI0006B935F9|nr:LysR family transcriptional regulator [Rhodopseudomonas sp. AAP120]KPG01562.1 LysR family transcriptional regulator [Rhodopseudomonas sp. AAP120]
MARLFDLDLLNALVVVAETGSISAAAPRLFRSQSAVSEQIRKLEEMCGLPLLSRGKTGASLTPAGERLSRYAHEMLTLSDAAFRDIQGTQLTGDLRLAITDYFRPGALPEILRRVRDQFPRLRLHVLIRKSALIEEEIAAGDYDIGLSMRILEGQPPRSKGDARIRLRREPLLWVSDRSFVMPQDGVLPLVVLPDTCSLQRFVVRKLKAHRIRHAVMHSASGVGGLHLALAAALGVTCLNASAVPEGAVKVGTSLGLPTLPEVEFSLMPPRAGESRFVADVRTMLAEQLR